MKYIEKCRQWYIFAFIGALIMIYACTEQMSQDDKSSDVKELTIAAARQWYESKYVPIVMTRTCEGEDDLPVRPDWRGSKAYSRGRFEAVETPMLTDRGHLIIDMETAKHWSPGMKTTFIRNTTRMVVLKDKVLGKTRSFIMIFIGSYDYLKDGGKMEQNNYLFREPDYDGLVYFYAINGKFINGWRYSDGKIVGYLSPSCAEQVSTRTPQLVCHEVCTMEYRTECYDEYVLVGGDMESGLVYDIFTTCGNVPVQVCTPQCEFIDDGYYPDNPYPPGGTGEPEDPDKFNPSLPVKTPCGKAQQLSSNADLKKRVDELFDKNSISASEDGWMDKNSNWRNNKAFHNGKWACELFFK